MISKIVQMGPDKIMFDLAFADCEMASFSKPHPDSRSQYNVDSQYVEQEWDEH